jgi:predicted nucleotidyltransferase
MCISSSKEEYLIPGHNGLETCVILSETRLFAEKRFMERETVKEVLRRFNESGVQYCLVGGLAVAHHAIPRQTEDVDILVFPEDLSRVQWLLQGHQLFSEDRSRVQWLLPERHWRRISGVLVFQIRETRIDIIPMYPVKSVVINATEGMIEGLPAKVVDLPDLILLKLLTAPERPKLSKRLQDEADVVALIDLNREKIPVEEIAYICRTLLAVAPTPEKKKIYRAQVEWLNSELEKLGMSDRCFPLP